MSLLHEAEILVITVILRNVGCGSILFELESPHPLWLLKSLETEEYKYACYFIFSTGSILNL